MAHRLPRYHAMAERWGVTVEAAEVEALRDPQDFEALVAAALGRRAMTGPDAPTPHRHGHGHGHGHGHARTPTPARSASRRC